MRIHADAPGGPGDSHFFEHLQGLLPGRGLVGHPMKQQGFDELILNAQERVQRGHRVLENHGDAAAANAIELSLGHLQQIFPFKKGFAGFNPSGWFWNQTHEGVAGDRFA